MSNLKATHEGILKIGDKELPVAVLQDGTRIITQTAIFTAFGRPMRGSRDKGDQTDGKLPGLIDAKNLQPFISADLRQVIKPIKYVDLNGKENQGYSALILPLICDVYVDARNAQRLDGRSVLTAKQLPNVFAAEMLLRALSKIGIIGLVDEVTGYEKIKEKDALQQFLEKFLLEERGRWIKTFPDEFFDMIFKMKGITWKTANKGKKPQWIGHIINNYVYSRIAPQVLAELRKVNPKNEKGNRKGKHTQWIDVDYGHPKLKEHLNILLAFGKATGFNETNWKRLVERALPQYDQKDGSSAPELGF